LVDLSKNEDIGEFSTDPSSGKFIVSLPGGRNYGAVFQAEGYLFISDNFDVPDTADYNEFNKDYFLKSVKVGSSIVLNNIFFETAKWDLKPESQNELDRLIGFMKANLKMKIEISGHTDNVGKEDYNQKLSENRAKAVVDFLVSKGVGSDRLTFKGYGKTQPIVSNDTPEGRAQNRRTEFKITDDK
jgi:outer membrane protein OmpA-like peptidoglycan-associated protein